VNYSAKLEWPSRTVSVGTLTVGQNWPFAFTGWLSRKRTEPALTIDWR
jgi:hypothetical protein